MKKNRCILCGSEKFKVIFSYNEPDRYEVVVGVNEKGYQRKWAQCENCKFAYSIYSRSKKDINKIYASTYRNKNVLWRNETSEEMFKKIAALPKNQSETALRIEWIKNRIPRKSGAALDIGGGSGVFAHAFKNKKWKTYVCDPDKHAEFIKTKLRIPLKTSFYKPDIFSRKFNLISLIYVLEHISNPLQLLKNVCKDMARDSFLFIEVPDAVAFEKKPQNDDIFNSTHLWMFSPNTLSNMLKKCGFNVIHIKRLKTIRGHFAIMALATQKTIDKRVKII